MLALIIMNTNMFKIVGFQKLAKTSANSKLVAEGYVLTIISATDPTVTHSLFRNPKQILIDLIQSGRLPASVTDWDNPRVHRAVARMNNKVFTADLTFNKAGESYIVDEHSKHYKAGTHKIGDKAIFEKDGVRANGFINCPITEDEIDRMERNELIAEMAINQQNQFGNIFANTDPFASFGVTNAPTVIDTLEESNDSEEESNTESEEDVLAKLGPSK